MNNNPRKQISSTQVYDNDWIELTEHRLLNAAGNPAIYGTIHFKNVAIGIIPIDNELNTWIVGQYRFPIGQYSWEIPEGGGPLHIEPEESAKRELLEEAGIIAERYTLIQEMYLSNAASDEKAFIFVAQDLSFTQSKPEESEVLQIKKMPFYELFNKVMRGEITDSLTVAGVLKLHILLTNKQIEL